MSRKGLKRRGMRSYEIGSWVITRDRPRRYYLRPVHLADAPPEFFSIRFKRLGDARAMAEQFPDGP